MTPPRPTAAQLEALRLAAIEPVRYFKGGWYSTPTVLGSQHSPAVGGAYTSPQTLRACVSRGWFDETGADIYARRWTITAAGRAALSAAGVDK